MLCATPVETRERERERLGGEGDERERDILLCLFPSTAPSPSHLLFFVLPLIEEKKDTHELQETDVLMRKDEKEGDCKEYINRRSKDREAEVKIQVKR